MSTWRVGVQQGGMIFRDEVCVGIAESPELAKKIVDALSPTEPDHLTETLDELHQLRLIVRDLANVAEKWLFLTIDCCLCSGDVRDNEKHGKNCPWYRAKEYRKQFAGNL